MRILYLTSLLGGGGGISKYNLGLLETLRECGVQLSVVEQRRSTLFHKLLFACLAFIKMVTFRPKFIISAHTNFLPLVIFLSKLFNVEYVVETYGIDVWNIKSESIKNALKEAKLILTVANYTKDKIVSQIPEVAERVTYLPNFIDEKKFYPKEQSLKVLKKYGINNSTKIILTLSRLWASEGYKGYDRVIEALPAVLKIVPGVKYIIAGSGDDEVRIRALIKRMGLESNIIMTGFVSDSERFELYNLCDVFAMPSKGEGFASVFLEALACGKPAVGGNADGTVDPLLHGELGILVNPDNVTEIAFALISILTKKASANLIDGNFLRMKVLETYGFPQFKERVAKIVRQLAK